MADDQVYRLLGKINNRGEPKLSAQAIQWPTPAAQNWKGSSPASITRADGKSRMDICGNPPYVGSSWQAKEQKEDLQRIFEGRTKSWKSLEGTSKNCPDLCAAVS